MGGRTYYVYILANRAGSLYVGVTNELERRVMEHRSGLIPGFTHRYSIDRLVYFEDCGEIEEAIAREKEIKGWRRSKKAALIASINPRWEDLGDQVDEIPRFARDDTAAGAATPKPSR